MTEQTIQLCSNIRRLIDFNLDAPTVAFFSQQSLREGIALAGRAELLTLIEVALKQKDQDTIEDCTEFLQKFCRRLPSTSHGFVQYRRWLFSVGQGWGAAYSIASDICCWLALQLSEDEVASALRRLFTDDLFVLLGLDADCENSFCSDETVWQLRIVERDAEVERLAR